MAHSCGIAGDQNANRNVYTEGQPFDISKMKGDFYWELHYRPFMFLCDKESAFILLVSWEFECDSVWNCALSHVWNTNVCGEVVLFTYYMDSQLDCL